MSSVVMKTYEQGDLSVECLWDKYAPYWHVRVLEVRDGTGYTLKDLTYGNRLEMERSYARQVRKLKKELDKEQFEEDYELLDKTCTSEQWEAFQRIMDIMKRRRSL